MANYAVGDLQGCYDDFCRLLEKLRFDPADDRLLLTGDLVNRGPQSLETLRFVRSLGAAAVTVLGNHDLHLLAVACHRGKLKPGDTLGPVLDAADAGELLDWLGAQPLAWQDPGRKLLMVHAGLPPQWDAAQALNLAAEVSAVLAGPRRATFFEHMYGDAPDRWDEALSGWDRIRFAVNCFTRLRFCSVDGRLELKSKGVPGSQPPGLLPWFEVPHRRTADQTVLFGHWSTLSRVHWPEHRVYGLDSGCVWGGKLTALELDSGALQQVACSGYQAPGGD